MLAVTVALPPPLQVASLQEEASMLRGQLDRAMGEAREERRLMAIQAGTQSDSDLT